MIINWLDEIDSTNSFVARNISTLQSGSVIAAHRQSAGRGQRGNSWESEPFANLTFSMLLRPADFPANKQFHLSEAVAVAITESIEKKCCISAKIKWPNDIYFNDLKLAGILIEHALMGRNILHTIIGVGLNVNQRKFFSDAPNPVSLAQIADKEFDLDTLLYDVCLRIEQRVDALRSDTDFNDIHSLYMNRLWRNDKCFHKFRDVASGNIYLGQIADIEPMGHLIVNEHSNYGQIIPHRYAFKEVEWIID